MMMGTPEEYYEWGAAALACIQLAIGIAGKARPESILDLPSGYGRVLRFLKAAFPTAALTACDLDEDAVRFCEAVFGAKPVVSAQDPVAIEFADKFDLIWCGSLFTHLPAERWHQFLNVFVRALSKESVVVFTTNGRAMYETIHRGQRTFGGPDPERMLRDYETQGFGFSARNRTGDYGASLSSPAWVSHLLERHPDLRLITYVEGGWRGLQDVVACISLPADM